MGVFGFGWFRGWVGGGRPKMGREHDVVERKTTAEETKQSRERGRDNISVPGR